VLKLNTTPVTVNQVITTANISQLNFVPVTYYNGNAVFSRKGYDGTVYSTTATATVSVNSINDAPTVSNSSKTVNEDTTMTFVSTDFTNNFSDPDADTLQKIKVTALPTSSEGYLKLAGANITINQEIVLASLAQITFVPTLNRNGQTNFTRQAADQIVYSTNTATLTLNVTAVNDAPTVSDFGKNGNEDTTL